MKIQLLAALLWFSALTFAQTSQSDEQTTDFITIDLNHAEAYVKAVFLDCPDYINQEQIDRGEEILTRIRIHKVDLGQYPECKKLSECSLRNKCNPSLDYNLENFDLETFNPLIYRLRFYSEQSEYYRIDNQNYIMEILPSTTTK